MFAFRINTPDAGIHGVNYGTIVLLFAMMVVVAGLHLAGFFDRIAELSIAHAGPRRLLPAIVFSSGILSAFLVNDIVCLLMAPLVMQVARRLSLRATPYLLALATASNIGSVATITGNPQNILIGSVSRISYLDFLGHLGPVAIVGLFIDWAVLHFIYFRKGQRPGPPVDLPMANVSKGSSRRSALTFSIVVTLAVLAGFLAGLPPAMVAAVGAAAVLIHPNYPSKQVYEEVDWSLLVFFVGLFLIIGGASQAGITQQMLSAAENLNLHNRWVFSGVVVVLSNIVSNVPAVMLLKDLLPNFQDAHHFWLLVALTSTLAGNLTITGSVANIIVVEKARQESPVGFLEYLKAGLPVTAATIVVGVLWLGWF